jgi:nicotinamide-nucleotide amidase
MRNQKPPGDVIFRRRRGKLEERVVSLLKERKKSIAVAESCSGGMIAEKLTSVPGVSEVFGAGIVSYSNEAKEEILGVSSKTLKKYGAVSPKCAAEMALGALYLSGADLALSVTGIAGPTGGTKEKPVGLVYVALATKNGIIVRKITAVGQPRNAS